MIDYGALKADRAISAVKRRLRITYTRASKELQEQLEEFVRKSEIRDKKKRKQLEEGKISKSEYQDWLAGQVFIRNQKESHVKAMQQVLERSNEEALKIIRKNQLDVFTENYNYTAFLGEMKTGISFDIYNTQAVARLIARNPQILPQWKPDEEKDYKWNYKTYQNSIKQGILQGLSVPDIAKRLCDRLATTNGNRMLLFARTGITEAQNAGRIQQMKDAEELGVKVKKRWLATIDRRTRDAHRQLDGQEQELDDPFESDLGEIMYPGDPHAAPANVYNCRCTLITVYPKYNDLVKHNLRKAYGEYEQEDGKTKRFSFLTTDPELYQKWKDEKKKQERTAESKQEERIQGLFSKTKKRYKTKEEYYKAVQERDAVRTQEIMDADKWYVEAQEKLVDEYGGRFMRQRIAVRQDDTLTDEEKAKKLDELKAKEEEYRARREKLSEEYNERYQKANEKYSSTFEPEYEYKKIKGKHTILEDSKAVNENYKEVGRDINCTKCSVAFEMRCRGYDVKAEAFEGSPAEVYSIFSKGSIFEKYGSGHENTLAVMDQMKEWGNGARAIAIVQRKHKTGHAFNVMQKDGRFWIVDGQLGVAWSDRDFGRDVNGGALEEDGVIYVQLLRVDKEPVSEIPVSFIRRNINDT